MNMREKFLSSVSYSFKETKVNWKGNEVFQFEKFKEEDPRNILKDENQIYLGLTDERMIFLDDLELEDSKLDPDLIMFASRHASNTERPAILIHTTGNWSDDNSFGGEKHDLSQTSALLHRAGFLSLLNQSKLQNLRDFVVDIEVTHHGPTLLKKPLVYIELGSSKKEWAHQLAARVVSNSIIDAYTLFVISITSVVNCLNNFSVPEAYSSPCVTKSRRSRIKLVSNFFISILKK